MDQEKLDAWVGAIRSLARQHGVAHRTRISDAIKEARRPLGATGLWHTRIEVSFKFAVNGGIPAEELFAIRTLLFD